MVDFINSNMRNFFFSNIEITITTFCKKLPTLSALVNHTSWTLKQNLLACEVHFLIILQSECSQGSLSITGWVASREILCNARVILHTAAWDLSWFGQEASAAPRPGNPGSRWWFGAENVDGHLHSAVRYEGSVSLWMGGCLGSGLQSSLKGWYIWHPELCCQNLQAFAVKTVWPWRYSHRLEVFRQAYNRLERNHAVDFTESWTMVFTKQGSW